jgi:pyrroloquinoline quinone (PQQ) biosynthesis protein C
MQAIQAVAMDPRRYPRLRENVWHIDPLAESALLLTSKAQYEVPVPDALKFLKMRSYCTGLNSVEDIARLSGLSPEEVSSTLEALEAVDVLFAPTPEVTKLPVQEVRQLLLRACELWSGELRDHYIGNEFPEGTLPKEALIGWLFEMYHYIKDFPHAIAYAASRAKGRLRELLVRYSNEESGHEVFVLQTLMNMGLSREAVETSIPLLSTRMVGFLMRELFELEPSTVLLVAAVLEAQEFNEEQIQLFKESVQGHYGLSPDVFEPYFKHQKIDVGLGHAELLADNLELIEVDELSKLDQITNKLHDLKHAFDLQGVELKAYFTHLDGKYVPRQRVDFLSI